MPSDPQRLDGAALLQDLAPKLSPAQVSSVASWLEAPHYASERPALLQALQRAQDDPKALQDLADAFAQILPIGTGGRRGTVAPGPNRINEVTMRESVYGLFCTMKALDWPLRVIVGYDTRATSRAFAHLCAKLLLQLGAQVLLLDAPRPTPQIAFWLRQRGCGAGVVISASHNPPQDNGIKMYGPDGAQVFAQRDRALTEAIRDQGAKAPACPPGPLGQHPQLERLDLEASDEGYLLEVLSRSVAPSRSFASLGPIVYTALQGVGITPIRALMAKRGAQLCCVPAQCDPGQGDFAATPATNPEQRPAFDEAIALAAKLDAKLVLAQDPDADRLGVALWSPRHRRHELLSGNRVAALLVDHVCAHLPPEELAQGLVASTVVTSPLVASIARSYGVHLVVDDLLVGFKNHAALVEQHPKLKLIFACEESLGYVRGRNIRDKDGTIAAMLVCELMSELDQADQSYEDRLEQLWQRHGYHSEYTENLRFPGQEGAVTMRKVMEHWRSSPPTTLGSFRAQHWIDRSVTASEHQGDPVRGATTNLLIGHFKDEKGTHAQVALRPSGTEPKLKLYLMCRADPKAPESLDAAKARVDASQSQLLDAALALLSSQS